MALMFRSVLQNDGGAAELIVTCDSEFAGATISCSDGTTTLNKTCPSSSPYEVTFKIPNSGDWTISATVSGTAYTSDPISVELDYTALLEYGFNWRRWVDTAQYLDSSDYDSLEEVLADEEALRELCLEHACVDYLANIATANEDVETIINNDLFAKWVNNSDYSLDVLGANVAIKAFMDTADKYGYGEWAVMPQVPKMTSNSAPYGTAICDSEMSGAYYAFDGDSSQNWNSSKKISEVNSNVYVGYVSTSPIVVKRAMIKLDIEASAVIKIQGSNTGNTDDWHDISEQTSIPNDGAIHYIDCSANSTAYSYHRALYVSETASNPTIYAGRCYILQFYAWQPKGNVPVMTSNTAPYGEVSASHEYSSSFQAWKAFNNDLSLNNLWIGTSKTNEYLRYKFANPTCVRAVVINDATINADVHIKNFRVEVSNDGTNFTPIYTGIADAVHGPQRFTFNNSAYYLYYQLYVLDEYNTETNIQISALQFYGRELSISVPTMTSNTPPYGTLIAMGERSGNEKYRAFDGTWTTGSGATAWGYGGDNNNYLGYIFPSPKRLKRVFYVLYRDANSAASFTAKIQGSNDGFVNDIHDLTEVMTISNPSQGVSGIIDIDTNTDYSGFRFLFVTPSQSGGGAPYFSFLQELQFYGKDYSEKEFEEGTTKKWLYDHGVELETLVPRVGANANNVITKRDSDLYLKLSGTNTSNGTYCNVLCQQDLSNYSLVRAKVGNEYYEGGTCFATQVFSSDAARPANGQYDDTYQVAISMIASQIPYDLSLDVSAINQDYWVSFGGGYYANCVLTLKELWLE